MWQAIETAPKDGEPLLLAWKSGSEQEWFVARGWWDTMFENVDWADEYKSAWTDGIVEDWRLRKIREIHPTHWQPLPEPPNA